MLSRKAADVRLFVYRGVLSRCDGGGRSLPVGRLFCGFFFSDCKVMLECRRSQKKL
jgi:hypothetical protein